MDELDDEEDLEDEDDSDDEDDIDVEDESDDDAAIEVPSMVIAEVSAPSRRRRAAGRPAGPPIHLD